MARLERFELPTPRFVVWYSIQLSYKRMVQQWWWRRERDSNPRYRLSQYTRLAGERLRPLGHLSKAGNGFSYIHDHCNECKLFKTLANSEQRQGLTTLLEVHQDQLGNGLERLENPLPCGGAGLKLWDIGRVQFFA